MRRRARFSGKNRKASLFDQPAAHQAGIADGGQARRKVPFHCHNRRFIMPARSYTGGKTVEYTAIGERSVQQV